MRRYLGDDDWDGKAVPLLQVPLPNGTDFAECVDTDGGTSFWLIVPDPVDDPVCVNCVPHEQLGNLPRDVDKRVKDVLLNRRYCGAPTKAGRPCQVRLQGAETRCYVHREIADRLDVDEAVSEA